VLLNYGIDELRFTKPIYPGAEIYIRFTCKEKLPNDKRIVENPEAPIAIGIKRGDDIDKGIVKWYVEMLDETDEITGIATILTMVARQNQS
jgi:oxepin-CoA hydrolase / 3-oxo-5,6-dehydrosuberyl-CoA semialdehyde dehydrogenase